MGMRTTSRRGMFARHATFLSTIPTSARDLPSDVTRTKRKLSIRYITPTFSGSPWWGEINMATLPLLSWCPHGGEKST